jgi:D-amino-acid oxidase
MWGIFDAPIEETGILSDGTNKIWYDQLVGGLRHLSKEELPKDAVFGIEFPTSFRINTAVYLYWYVKSYLYSSYTTNSSPRLQTQVLAKGIKLIRRPYTSISSLLTDLPATNLLINATGLGSLHLTDVRDTNLYPTRGQTVLVAEPKTPISRMYEFEKSYKYEARSFCASFSYDPPMIHSPFRLFSKAL